MGQQQSSFNLKTLKKKNLMNQSINGFFKEKCINYNRNAVNSNVVQLSNLKRQMNNENIIELSYTLMSTIAMTKVNTFNKSLYYPITLFNPFEACDNNSSYNDKNHFLFDSEYSENVNKMFNDPIENNTNGNVPFSIDEDLNEDLDNSEENKRNEENKSKNHYEQRYVSSSMKRIMTSKRSDKVGSDHLSKYSEIVSSRSSENQALESDKRKKTKMKDNNEYNVTMKPVVSLIKSKTVGSDINTNANIINETKNGYDNSNSTDENIKEQPESIMNEHEYHKEGKDCAKYYKKTNQMIFKIEIQKIIKEERAKKLYQQQRKLCKHIKSNEESKNTAFIEQINKYMELDTSYNIKLNEIKSNKKMAVVKLKHHPPCVKVKQVKRSKIKQNTNIIPNIISYNDLISVQFNNNKSFRNQSAINNDTNEDKESNYRRQVYQIQKQEESNYISNDDDDEFVSACSSFHRSDSNNYQFSSSQRNNSGLILNEMGNKSGFYEAKRNTFEEYD